MALSATVPLSIEAFQGKGQVIGIAILRGSGVDLEVQGWVPGEICAWGLPVAALDWFCHVVSFCRSDFFLFSFS